MPAKTKPAIGPDTRAWALGIFCDPNRPGIDPARLTPGRRRHVDAMLEAGWLRRDRGLLYLDTAGREAIEQLLPSAVPRLSEAQEELLEQALKGSTTSDLSHPPTLKLIAYGLVDPVQQRFGGLKLVPTQRARDWAERRTSAEAPPPDTAFPRP